MKKKVTPNIVSKMKNFKNIVRFKSKQNILGLKKNNSSKHSNPASRRPSRLDINNNNDRVDSIDLFG